MIEIQLDSRLKYVINRKVNKNLIPVTSLSFSEEDIKLFNSVYRFVIKNIEKRITRTASGGICIKEEAIRGNQWDIKATKTVIELTFKYFSKWYRLQIGYKKSDADKKVYGHQAWKIFVSLCKDNHIEIKDYRLSSTEEGLAEKEQIVKPLIDLGESGEIKKVYTNVHHLDYNSSYAYGIVEKVPELEPVIQELYTKRKKNPKYKEVLAILHGYMQSAGVSYRYSHIARHANKSNRDRVEALADKLRAAGRKIILFNTDGIWYQGDVYHDENEGTALGQWKNDHIDCKFRIKSKGVYEFIEDGVYTPVFRGTSTLERVKPRSTWEWGDIFKGSIVEYTFIPGIGIIRENC